MGWCKKNNNDYLKYDTNLIRFNRTEQNLMNFMNFIKNHHDDEQFIKDLKRISTFLKEIKDSPHYSNLDKQNFMNTMRMTACEIVKN